VIVSWHRDSEKLPFGFLDRHWKWERSHREQSHARLRAPTVRSEQGSKLLSPTCERTPVPDPQCFRAKIDAHVSKTLEKVEKAVAAEFAAKRSKQPRPRQSRNLSPWPKQILQDSGGAFQAPRIVVSRTRRPAVSKHALSWDGRACLRGFRRVADHPPSNSLQVHRRSLERQLRPACSSMRQVISPRLSCASKDGCSTQSDVHLSTDL
jgi:hypothetical protein